MIVVNLTSGDVEAMWQHKEHELALWRAGYAQALYDSGPTPQSEDDERKFRIYYRDAAAKRSPTAL